MEKTRIKGPEGLTRERKEASDFTKKRITAFTGFWISLIRGRQSLPEEASSTHRRVWSLWRRTVM